MERFEGKILVVTIIMHFLYLYKQISSYILFFVSKIQNIIIIVFIAMISILEPYGDKSSSSSCSISFYLHPRRWPLPASRPFRPGSLQQTLFQVRFLLSLLMIMNINVHTTRALPEFIDTDTIPPGFTSLHEFLDTYTTWVVSIQKKYIGS